MFRRVAAFALHTHYEYYVSRHTLSPLVIVYALISMAYARLAKLSSLINNAEVSAVRIQINKLLIKQHYSSDYVKVSLH